MRELTLLLLALLIVQVHANANDAKKGKLKLTPPGQKAQVTEDPGSATRLLYEDPRNSNSLTSDIDLDKGKKKVVTATCTDNMGMLYKAGDQGYEACLRSFNGKQPPQLRGDDKRPNSLGFTIGQ